MDIPEEPGKKGSLGCFGSWSSSQEITKLNQGQNSVNLSTKGTPRSSTFSRWFNNSANDDSNPDVDTEEALDSFSVNDLLANLDELVKEEQHKTDKNPLSSPNTPAHERKRSWPFGVGRRVAPVVVTVPPPNLKPSSADSSVKGPKSPAVSGELDLKIERDSSNSIASTSELSPSTANTTDGSNSQEFEAVPDSLTAEETGDGSVSATRRLWKTISSVRKGDKVVSVNAKSPGREVTVESLVRSAQQLKPGQSISEAPRLMEGLHRLDSRAIAALLKDLAKAGLPHRASELFDYLRALPADDELSHLADLYTYTTVISQCVGHQQLRRALELVAEMRSKGIQCNVHTYSALMSVCVKCNECELALDVFDQLVSENCTPNLVTYNILIDAFSKTSQWSKAVEVLDKIRDQGLIAEARTYNSVISSCGKCGQAAAAVEVYRAMLKDGVEPTGTTYTSVVSAFGRTGQVDEALEVYEEMKTRNCERNVITFSSLISVCERAGRADVALCLLGEMRELGVKPNVVTYNGLIGACVSAGKWEEAVDLYDEMLAAGCRPDAATFANLLHACDRSGQWKQTIQALDQMQQRGIRPDSCAYNSALNALWVSGRLPALRRAVQILAAAQRQGPLRLQATSPTDATVPAYTPGAVALVALRWLADLRDMLTVPGFMPPRPFKTLLMTRVKHARDGLPAFPAVQSELSALLSAFGAPVTVDGGVQGILVTVDMMGLPVWAASAGGQALLSAVDGVGGMPVFPTSTVLKDDRAAEIQCGKAFAAVREFETSHADWKEPSSPTTLQIRQDVIACITALSTALGLREETSHDAVQLCDRLLATASATQQPPPAACAAALLLLAGRQSGEAATLLRNGQMTLQTAGLPQSAVLEAEARVLAALNGDGSAISALRVLQLYLERLGCDMLSLQKCQLLHVMVLSAINMVTKAALSPIMARFPPSAVAAACLIKARGSMGLAPAWPEVLSNMTGLSLENDIVLKDCLELLVLLGI